MVIANTMVDRPPFDMQRAAFILLAVIALIMMAETLMASIGCVYSALSGGTTIGTCVERGIAGHIREIFTETLTAILALLLAARNDPNK